MCKKGYLRIGEECIDKTAINAKLRGENPVYIELGDYYEDAGMDLEDHNKEVSAYIFRCAIAVSYGVGVFRFPSTLWTLIGRMDSCIILARGGGVLVFWE